MHGWERHKSHTRGLASSGPVQCGMLFDQLTVPAGKWWHKGWYWVDSPLRALGILTCKGAEPQ